VGTDKTSGDLDNLKKALETVKDRDEELKFTSEQGMKDFIDKMMKEGDKVDIKQVKKDETAKGNEVMKAEIRKLTREVLPNTNFLDDAVLKDAGRIKGLQRNYPDRDPEEVQLEAIKKVLTAIKDYQKSSEKSSSDKVLSPEVIQAMMNDAISGHKIKPSTLGL
jgi:hypothetical protein